MKPRIKDSVRQVFLELLIDPNLRYASVSAIYAEGSRQIIEEDGGSENDLPSLDWLYKYVAAAKNRLPKNDQWLEQEWSIGSVFDPVFPDTPTVTKLIMELWRRAAVGGRTLTNRTAKWTAYLVRPFLKNYRTIDGYGISGRGQPITAAMNLRL